MSPQVTSTNPLVEKLISGTAPQPARLAAAQGLMPLPQADLLEVLVAFQESDDAEIAEAAKSTLESQDPEELLIAAKLEETPAPVLAYLGSIPARKAIHEAIVLNPRTPDAAIATLATLTKDSSVLEMIAGNQQRLVRTPAIIDAILGNAARTSDAERRARETRREFFEKERGARQIATELRARGKTAAAEFFENAELTTVAGTLSIEDAWLIAEHIEVSDSDIDDSWMPAERYDDLVAETAADRAAAVQRIIESEKLEAGEVPPERVTLISRLMLMNPRDRMKLALKGDREARSILIRDSNKVVSAAVINNPRISDQEVENIASMRTVSDEILRLIAQSRSWARSYPIIHNLVRNPKSPIPTVVGILPRIRTKDLQNLSQNRNVSEAVRRQANRLTQARTGG